MKAWPEDLPIIKRRRVEVNALTSTPRGNIFRSLLRVGLLVCLCVAFGCSSDEEKAQALHAKALEAMKEEKMDEALQHYRDIVDRFPLTDAADEARERITFLSGLNSAVDRFPSRTARDLVILTGRAIENYRRRQGKYPDSLDALLPKLLEEPSIDPWGRPLIYEREGRGYRLSCLGADGRFGGQGDATDFVVVNGKLVSNPSGE